MLILHVMSPIMSNYLQQLTRANVTLTRNQRNILIIVLQRPNLNTLTYAISSRQAPCFLKLHLHHPINIAKLELANPAWVLIRERKHNFILCTTQLTFIDLFKCSMNDEMFTCAATV